MADGASLDLEAFRPAFERAFPGQGDAFDHVMAEVRAGRAHLEISPSGKSVMVLQQVKALHCWGAMGEMDEIVAMEADIAERAKAFGYDRLTILPSRGGWDRVLRKAGWIYEPVRALVKEL